jgi:hypothetical protein
MLTCIMCSLLFAKHQNETRYSEQHLEKAKNMHCIAGRTNIHDYCADIYHLVTLQFKDQMDEVPKQVAGAFLKNLDPIYYQYLQTSGCFMAAATPTVDCTDWATIIYTEEHRRKAYAPRTYTQTNYRDNSCDRDSSQDRSCRYSYSRSPTPRSGGVNAVTSDSDSETQKPKENLCFNCNKPGHFSRECPEPRKQRQPFNQNRSRYDRTQNSPVRSSNSNRQYGKPDSSNYKRTPPDNTNYRRTSSPNTYRNNKPIDRTQRTSTPPRTWQNASPPARRSPSPVDKTTLDMIYKLKRSQCTCKSGKTVLECQCPDGEFFQRKFATGTSLVTSEAHK